MTPEEALTDPSGFFAQQRRIMVDSQIRTCDVTDPELLTALYEVPRERFVAPGQAAVAYADRTVLAAGGRRQLLAPMVIARMIQAAKLRGTEAVLDIAGGSGYAAALMARLARSVVALEADAEQTAAAKAALAAGGETRVSCVTGALEDGHADGAPFDVILIEGTIEVHPAALAGQLRDGGRLIAIDVAEGTPKAAWFERTGADLSRRALFNAAAPVIDAFRKPPAFVF